MDNMSDGGHPDIDETSGRVASTDGQLPKTTAASDPDRKSSDSNISHLPALQAPSETSLALDFMFFFSSN